MKNLKEVPYMIQKSLIKFGFRICFLISDMDNDHYISIFVQSVVDEVLGSKIMVNMIEMEGIKWIEEVLILCYNQYYPIEDDDLFFKNFNIFFKNHNIHEKLIYKLVSFLDMGHRLLEDKNSDNKKNINENKKKKENNEIEITENLNKKSFDKEKTNGDKNKKDYSNWNREMNLHPEEEQKVEEKDDILIATKNILLYKILEKDETINKVLLDASKNEIPRKKRLIFCVAITERMPDKWKEKFSNLTSYCDKLLICIQFMKKYKSNTDDLKEEGDPFEFKFFFRTPREKEFDELRKFLKEQIEAGIL